METDYRTFLLRISQHITEGKLKELKYLCSDDIHEGELENISSPLDLFRELERREMIGIDKLSFLRKLLMDVDRLKLASKVDDFTSRREVELLCLKRQRQQINYKQEAVRVPRSECVPMDGDGGNHSPDYRQELAAITSCTVTDGGQAGDQMSELHTGKCSCFIHHSPDQRKQGEIYLRLALELATKGAWVAGTAFILKRYINDPETLARLFASVVLPSGVLVKYLCEGSIICVLEANDLRGLKELWQNYESGKLQEKLEYILITEDLRNLSAGQDIILNVVLDENMFREVCLELMVTKGKVDQIFQGVEQRPRSLSDPITNQRKKPENTFQQQSLHIVANTERKRRLDAEKKLQQLMSGQSLELQFPELRHFTDKTAADGANESDDNSSTTSTLDEEEVLDWEDDNDMSKEFWSSIKGSLKEKTWSNFEDAVEKECPDDLKRGGTPLMKFLAYVLRVNYAKRKSDDVSLHNFIRLSRWFGSFIKGPQGCLHKMTHLMENSVSVDSDGKGASWFAGHMTEQQAKEKLRNEKGGAFLVRFNTPAGFLLSKKSRAGDSVLDFAIGVHKDTGYVEFDERVFQDLPSLVKELQKSWMTDLRPFYSTEGTETESSPQEP